MTKTLGLQVALGHGITLANVGALAKLPEVHEFNIGHALIGDAIFLSLAGAVRSYRGALDAARSSDA